MSLLRRQQVVWSLVQAFSHVKKTVLQDWCADFPSRATTILPEVRTAGFTFFSAAYLVEVMENALVRSAPSSSTSESPMSKLSSDIVKGPLMEIKATKIVDNTLMAIKAQGMVNSAMEELR